MNRFTPEGPTDDETRIIGVELAIRDERGVERELQMFACTHTLPAREQPWMTRSVRVTLHTSRGDLTLRGEL